MGLCFAFSARFRCFVWWVKVVELFLGIQSEWGGRGVQGLPWSCLPAFNLSPVLTWTRMKPIHQHVLRLAKMKDLHHTHHSPAHHARGGDQGHPLLSHLNPFQSANNESSPLSYITQKKGERNAIPLESWMIIIGSLFSGPCHAVFSFIFYKGFCLKMIWFSWRKTRSLLLTMG